MKKSNTRSFPKSLPKTAFGGSKCNNSDYKRSRNSSLSSVSHNNKNCSSVSKEQFSRVRSVSTGADHSCNKSSFDFCHQSAPSCGNTPKYEKSISSGHCYGSDISSNKFKGLSDHNTNAVSPSKAAASMSWNTGKPNDKCSTASSHTVSSKSAMGGISNQHSPFSHSGVYGGGTSKSNYAVPNNSASKVSNSCTPPQQKICSPTSCDGVKGHANVQTTGTHFLQPACLTPSTYGSSCVKPLPNKQGFQNITESSWFTKKPSVTDKIPKKSESGNIFGTSSVSVASSLTGKSSKNNLSDTVSNHAISNYSLLTASKPSTHNSSNFSGQLHKDSHTTVPLSATSASVKPISDKKGFQNFTENSTSAKKHSMNDQFQNKSGLGSSFGTSVSVSSSMAEKSSKNPLPGTASVFTVPKLSTPVTTMSNGQVHKNSHTAAPMSSIFVAAKSEPNKLGFQIVNESPSNTKKPSSTDQFQHKPVPGSTFGTSSVSVFSSMTGKSSRNPLSESASLMTASKPSTHDTTMNSGHLPKSNHTAAPLSSISVGAKPKPEKLGYQAITESLSFTKKPSASDQFQTQSGSGNIFGNSLSVASSVAAKSSKNPRSDTASNQALSTYSLLTAAKPSACDSSMFSGQSHHSSQAAFPLSSIAVAVKPLSDKHSFQTVTENLTSNKKPSTDQFHNQSGPGHIFGGSSLSAASSATEKSVKNPMANTTLKQELSNCRPSVVPPTLDIGHLYKTKETSKLNEKLEPNKHDFKNVTDRSSFIKTSSAADTFHNNPGSNNKPNFKNIAESSSFMTNLSVANKFQNLGSNNISDNSSFSVPSSLKDKLSKELLPETVHNRTLPGYSNYSLPAASQPSKQDTSLCSGQLLKSSQTSSSSGMCLESKTGNIQSSKKNKLLLDTTSGYHTAVKSAKTSQDSKNLTCAVVASKDTNMLSQPKNENCHDLSCKNISMSAPEVSHVHNEKAHKKGIFSSLFPLHLHKNKRVCSSRNSDSENITNFSGSVKAQPSLAASHASATENNSHVAQSSLNQINSSKNRGQRDPDALWRSSTKEHSMSMHNSFSDFLPYSFSNQHNKEGSKLKKSSNMCEDFSNSSHKDSKANLPNTTDVSKTTSSKHSTSQNFVQRNENFLDAKTSDIFVNIKVPELCSSSSSHPPKSQQHVEKQNHQISHDACTASTKNLTEASKLNNSVPCSKLQDPSSTASYNQPLYPNLHMEKQCNQSSLHNNDVSSAVHGFCSNYALNNKLSDNRPKAGKLEIHETVSKSAQSQEQKDSQYRKAMNNVLQSNIAGSVPTFDDKCANVNDNLLKICNNQSQPASASTATPKTCIIRPVDVKSHTDSHPSVSKANMPSNKNDTRDIVLKNTNGSDILLGTDLLLPITEHGSHLINTSGSLSAAVTTKSSSTVHPPGNLSVAHKLSPDRYNCVSPNILASSSKDIFPVCNVQHANINEVTSNSSSPSLHASISGTTTADGSSLNRVSNALSQVLSPGIKSEGVSSSKPGNSLFSISNLSHVISTGPLKKTSSPKKCQKTPHPMFKFPLLTNDTEKRKKDTPGNSDNGFASAASGITHGGIIPSSEGPTNIFESTNSGQNSTLISRSHSQGISGANMHSKQLGMSNTEQNTSALYARSGSEMSSVINSRGQAVPVSLYSQAAILSALMFSGANSANRNRASPCTRQVRYTRNSAERHTVKPTGWRDRTSGLTALGLALPLLANEATRLQTPTQNDAESSLPSYSCRNEVPTARLEHLNQISSRRNRLILQDVDDFKNAYQEATEAVRNGSELIASGDYLEACTEFELGLRLMDCILDARIDDMSPLDKTVCRSIQEAVRNDRIAALEGFSDTQSAFVPPRDTLPPILPEGAPSAPPSYTDVLREDLEKTLFTGSKQPLNGATNGFSKYLMEGAVANAVPSAPLEMVCEELPLRPPCYTSYECSFDEQNSLTDMSSDFQPSAPQLSAAPSLSTLPQNTSSDNNVNMEDTEVLGASCVVESSQCSSADCHFSAALAEPTTAFLSVNTTANDKTAVPGLLAEANSTSKSAHSTTAALSTAGSISTTTATSHSVSASPVHNINPSSNDKQNAAKPVQLSDPPTSTSLSKSLSSYENNFSLGPQHIDLCLIQQKNETEASDFKITDQNNSGSSTIHITPSKMSPQTIQPQDSYLCRRQVQWPELDESNKRIPTESPTVFDSLEAQATVMDEDQEKLTTNINDEKRNIDDSKASVKEKIRVTCLSDTPADPNNQLNTKDSEGGSTKSQSAMLVGVALPLDDAAPELNAKNVRSSSAAAGPMPPVPSFSQMILSPSDLRQPRPLNFPPDVVVAKGASEVAGCATIERHGSNSDLKCAKEKTILPSKELERQDIKESTYKGLKDCNDHWLTNETNSPLHKTCPIVIDTNKNEESLDTKSSSDKKTDEQLNDDPSETKTPVTTVNMSHSEPSLTAMGTFQLREQVIPNVVPFHHHGKIMSIENHYGNDDSNHTTAKPSTVFPPSQSCQVLDNRDKMFQQINCADSNNKVVNNDKMDCHCLRNIRVSHSTEKQPSNQLYDGLTSKECFISNGTSSRMLRDNDSPPPSYSLIANDGIQDINVSNTATVNYSTEVLPQYDQRRTDHSPQSSDKLQIEKTINENFSVEKARQIELTENYFRSSYEQEELKLKKKGCDSSEKKSKTDIAKELYKPPSHEKNSTDKSETDLVDEKSYRQINNNFETKVPEPYEESIHNVSKNSAPECTSAKNGISSNPSSPLVDRDPSLGSPGISTATSDSSVNSKTESGLQQNWKSLSSWSLIGNKGNRRRRATSVDEGRLIGRSYFYTDIEVEDDDDVTVGEERGPWIVIMKLEKVKIYFMKEDNSITSPFNRRTLVVLKEKAHPVERKAKVCLEVGPQSQPIWVHSLNIASTDILKTMSGIYILTDKPESFVAIEPSSGTKYSEKQQFEQILKDNSLFQQETLAKSQSFREPHKGFRRVENILKERTPNLHFQTKDITRKSVRVVHNAASSISKSVNNFMCVAGDRSSPSSTSLTKKLYGRMEVLQIQGQRLEEAHWNRSIIYI